MDNMDTHTNCEEHGERMERLFPGYPCTECGRVGCNYERCLRYAVWLKRVWRKVIGKLKRRTK